MTAAILRDSHVAAADLGPSAKSQEVLLGFGPQEKAQLPSIPHPSTEHKEGKACGTPRGSQARAG